MLLGGERRNFTLFFPSTLDSSLFEFKMSSFNMAGASNFSEPVKFSFVQKMYDGMSFIFMDMRFSRLLYL